MKLFYLFFGSAIYFIYFTIQYADTIRLSKWFPLIALGFGMSANLIWGLLAQRLVTKSDVFSYGIYWDALMIAPCFIIPFLVYGIRLSALTIVGAVLVFGGTFLVHIGR